MILGHEMIIYVKGFFVFIMMKLSLGQNVTLCMFCLGMMNCKCVIKELVWFTVIM